MKKTISMLCVVLVVGFAGTAFAGRKAKENVCHHGSVWEKFDGSEVQLGDAPDSGEWVPGTFVINISGNAVTAHERNHGDFVEPNFSEGADVVTEVTFGDDGSGTETIVITGFEIQPSCEAAEVIE